MDLDDESSFPYAMLNIAPVIDTEPVARTGKGYQPVGPSIERSVEYEGYYYATLDGTEPDDPDCHGWQEDFIRLPKGWQLAPPQQGIIKNVVATHGWGCQAMVFADGSMWCCKLFKTAGGHHGDGILEKNGNEYRPNVHIKSIQDTIRPGMMTGRNPIPCGKYRILVRTPCRLEWDPASHCVFVMEGLWADRSFSDCQVACGDQVFECHRAILSKGSPVFQRMLSSDFIEGQRQRVQVCEAEPAVVEALLKFLYTGQVESENHAIELMTLADFYQMESLVTLCAEVALDNVSRDNIASIARALRSVQGRPAFSAMWARLMDKAREDSSLLSAVMHQV